MLRFCFLVLVFWSLQPFESVLASDTAGEKLPIIFVPGYKGSILKDQQGQVRWIQLTQALNLESSQLALPLSYDSQGLQESDHLLAADILKSFVVIPFVYEVELYQGDLDFLASLGRPFSYFYYDWRRDNFESLLKLKEFVEQKLSETGASKVHLVGHSMGGLIASAFFASWPHLVESAVFAGAPFGGTMRAWEGLHAGSRHGLNTEIISAAVAASFGSIYSMLDYRLESFMLAPGQERSAFDLSQAETWKRLRLSRFAMDDMDGELFQDFLAVSLKRGQEFQQLANLSPAMQARAQHILVIAGSGMQTPAKVLFEGPEAVRGWDMESSTSQYGDGQVLESLAKPSGLSGFVLLQIQASHRDLLATPEAQQALREWFARRP